MESFKKYLQQFPRFSQASFELALPYLKEVEIKAGDSFLEQGQVCRKLGFISKGLFRLYYLKDGKEVTNCFCKENTISTSYRSLITGQASEMSIQAIEDSTLILLTKEQLQELYKKDLFWQQLGRMAAENEFITTESHTRFLTDLSATERYQQILDKDKELLQRVPLQYLASYLQIAPETLSRIRKKASLI